jgi:hypothetical protein
MTSPGNAWEEHGNKHHLFHPTGSSSTQQDEGHQLWRFVTGLVCPEKIDEPNRTRLVAGGDQVHYPGDAGMPTADLLTIKLLINSIISTQGAKFMTMDI